MPTRKQMIAELVDAKYPGSNKPVSREAFRKGLEEQSDTYIRAAYDSIRPNLFGTAKEEQHSAQSETPRGTCPRCGYSCLPSSKQPGKFYCGVCTGIDNGTPFYF